MTTLRSLTGATVLAGAIAVGALGFPAVGSADPNAVPPALLNTTCSLDQLMAAAKVVDTVLYGEVIGKYNSEPRWLQGGAIYHMNLLLQKPPAQRQAEVDQLAGVFPVYMSLFRAAEPTANAIAAKCPTFPAEDPAVWNAAAPAPAPVNPAPAPAAPAPAPVPAPAPTPVPAPAA